MTRYPLRAWCLEAFGAHPVETLFEAGHLSRVTGYRLANGHCVVVKQRPQAERVLSCLDLQLHLWQRGYPCPEPLAGPSLLDGRLVTAEAYVTPGETLRGPQAAPQFAGALVRLLALSAGLEPRLTLEPPPPWLGGWQPTGPALWPAADDLPDDLNAVVTPWLDDIARRVAAVLQASTLPRVIGHADWTAANLEWSDGELHVVHDWDSLAYLPEAVFAGGASVVYTSSSTAVATLEESEAFLAAYETARGMAFTAEEGSGFWAAGLWNLAFDAKKDVVRGGGESLAQIQAEGEARLVLALS